MKYMHSPSLKLYLYRALLAVLFLSLPATTVRAETLELICHDEYGHARLLTAHTDAMLIYNPSRPQDIYWLDTSKKNYLDLLAFENGAWTFIYDQHRKIGTLYQRVFGDFYICEERRPI
jgi:hypothetical protein